MTIALINARETPEVRVAILSDGKVISYHYGLTTETEQNAGNIYRGRIERIEYGLDAAFVDVGSRRHAFLPLLNIPPSIGGEKDSPRKRGRIRVKQTVIVQVVREPTENKGALLTGYISIPGRYLVLSPYEQGVRISRKMKDASERERLYKTVKSMAPQSFAFIVRTAAVGTRKTDIAKDMRYVLRLYRKIVQEANRNPAPCLLYSDADITTRIVREFLPSDVEEIVVDEKEQLERLKKNLKVLLPRLTRCLRLYDSILPLFASYSVEEQIEGLESREVPLPSGGRIVIEQTEALVSIDINSGGLKGADMEQTAYQTNLEAVEEIARQLRLRDLGGLIVIDLIDMEKKEHRIAVERRLREAMRADRAKHTILPTNRLGLMTLSRQRQSSLLETTTYPCRVCGGGGRLKEPLTLAARALRKVQSFLVSNPSPKVRLLLPPDVAEMLFNRMRSALMAVEKRCGTRIYVTPAELSHDDFQILPVGVD